MRTTTLLLTALLVGSAVLAVAPAAEARPCVQDTCVGDEICVFSPYNEPGCLVRNPCDPRYCDPWLP